MAKLALLTMAALPARQPGGGGAAHQHCRGGELLRRCRPAGGGTQRNRQQHHEQPRPGPASVRGKSIGRAPAVRRRDRGLQWRGLRSVDGQAAVGRAVAQPQGHRGGQPGAQEARRQSASLVRSADHAGLCEGAGSGPVATRPGAQGGLRSALAGLPATSLQPLQAKIAEIRHKFARHSCHRHRAGVRLYGDRTRLQDAQRTLPACGDERHRAACFRRGRDRGRPAQASCARAVLQQPGDRHRGAAPGSRSPSSRRSLSSA